MPLAPPYSLPLRRDLTDEERGLLHFILAREAPDRMQEVANLKVVARCGCGSCPTVMFGLSLEAEPRRTPAFTEMASYMGRNAEGVLVAISLLEREGHISELEAWAPEGADIAAWPPLSALERMDGTEG